MLSKPCLASKSRSSAGTKGSATTSDFARQYLPAMKKVWADVEKLFDPVTVLKPQGHQFVQTYAIKAAHPELPYAMQYLSMMAPLSNGAQVAIFPSASSPLMAVTINVNYAQTRQSSITGNADAIGKELDAVVMAALEAKMTVALQDQASAAAAGSSRSTR